MRTNATHIEIWAWIKATKFAKNLWSYRNLKKQLDSQEFKSCTVWRFTSLWTSQIIRFTCQRSSLNSWTFGWSSRIKSRTWWWREQPWCLNQYRALSGNSFRRSPEAVDHKHFNKTQHHCTLTKNATVSIILSKHIYWWWAIISKSHLRADNFLNLASFATIRFNFKTLKKEKNMK